MKTGFLSKPVRIILSVILLIIFFLINFFFNTLISFRDIYLLHLTFTIIFTLLSVSPLFFILLQETLRASWSLNIYSLFPSEKKYILIASIFWLPVFFLYSYFFPPDHSLNLIARIWSYPLFLFIRTSIFLFLWIILYQHTTNLLVVEHHKSLLSKRAPFLLLVLLFSMIIFSWDWLVLPQNNPHAGITAFQSIIITTGFSVCLISVKHRNKLNVPDNLNDLSKYFLLFCVLWVYFFFSHLLITEYEASHSLMNNKLSVDYKMILASLSLILCFIFPFSLLISRKQRIKPRNLLWSCISFICGNFCWILLLYAEYFNHSLFFLLCQLSVFIIFLLSLKPFRFNFISMK